MKLKRITDTFNYKNKRKLSRQRLLTQFNPYYIADKIKFLEQQIEDMYHLNVSHSESTVYGFVSVSYPIEKLAIWIIEQKKALERYKKQSNHNIWMLKQSLNSFSAHERSIIYNFMKTNDYTSHDELLDMLAYDLYESVIKEREQRAQARKMRLEQSRLEHVQLIKSQLHIKQEVLSL